MSASAMYASIKNNLNLLSKRKKLKHKLGGYDPKKITEYNLPKANAKMLKDIKKNILMQEQVRHIKVIGLTVVCFIMLVFSVLYIVDYIM